MALGSTGWTRRHLALTLGVVVGAFGLLAFAAVASAHHAKAHHNNPPCDAYFSTSEVSTLEDVAMQPYLNGQGKPVESWPAGTDNSIWSTGTGSKIAGSECPWINATGGGLGDGDSLQAWAAVGYGESQKSWKAMWANGGPPFTSQEGTLQSTTKVSVSIPGAQAAYLQTFDLWAYTGQSYFVPPKYLYALTVMTKHHNILLFAPETVPLGDVESAMTEALKAHPKF
jgi:hypothetical protein